MLYFNYNQEPSEYYSQLFRPLYLPCAWGCGFREACAEGFGQVAVCIDD